MAESNLGAFRREVISGGDEVIVIRALADLPGGRTLSVARYAETLRAYAAAHPELELAEAAYAGSPVGLEAASGAYAVLPLDAQGAFMLPPGVAPVGVLRAGVPLDDPRGAIVTQGQVNWAAMPLKVPEAVRRALPLVEFLYVPAGGGVGAAG